MAPDISLVNEQGHAIQLLRDALGQVEGGTLLGLQASSIV